MVANTRNRGSENKRGQGTNKGEQDVSSRFLGQLAGPAERAGVRGRVWPRGVATPPRRVRTGPSWIRRLRAGDGTNAAPSPGAGRHEIEAGSTYRGAADGHVKEDLGVRHFEGVVGGVCGLRVELVCVDGWDAAGKNVSISCGRFLISRDCAAAAALGRPRLIASHTHPATLPRRRHSCSACRHARSRPVVRVHVPPDRGHLRARGQPPQRCVIA